METTWEFILKNKVAWKPISKDKYTRYRLIPLTVAGNKMALRLNLLTYVTFAALIFPAWNRVLDAQTSDDWICVGGDRACTRYSTLDQITRDNVNQLQVAWVYHTGELVDGKGSTIECTPLIVDGVMYITTANRRVVALEGATGKVLWDFDPACYPRPASPMASGGVNRGAAYWSDPREPNVKRIFHGTADGWLFSIDAATGKLDPNFGKNGAKDLREDLDRDVANLPYGPTSAPAILDDVVILGVSNGEGPDIAAPGDVRAFDARTGAQRWRFHTVPRPGEFGNETWAEDSWKNRGGANAWGGCSVDVKRGLVFAALGSATFDFYGGDRHGDNLFANCVLALDGRTGERRWHFQTLRHDLWDHDLPVYPNLVTIERDGKSIDAVAQVTKTGFVFVLDRETGKPLFDIDDVEVPASDIPGEQAATHQPVPRLPPPFSPQSIDENNVTDIGEANRQAALELLAKLRHGAAFQPPSFEGTVIIPGFHGGANWSGASYDPTTCTLYLNSTNEPNIMGLAPAPEGSRFPYTHRGYGKFVDQEGYPAIKPPWGVLNAIDLRSGKFVWQVPLGEFPELTARGVPQTGTPNFGGTIVTAGGLVFIAATKDEMIRGFDKTTGKVLWQSQLPAGGYATPATYRANGKQYVVIAASGAGKLGTKPGDAFVAFALPETRATGTSEPIKKLILPGESFRIDGHPAFILWPEESLRKQPQPWVFYAPTLPDYPDENEKWMHEQFLAAGVAVAGIDVGEAYGSPESCAVFDKLYDELTERRGFAQRPCLLGRSRGGLWVTSWACSHPDRFSGLAGIYPVFDFRTYPGLEKAAAAYELTTDELTRRNNELNPIQKMVALARARLPVFIIHGDQDTVVPLAENSATFAATYHAAGADDALELIVASGQGHNMWEGFFRCQPLVDFVVKHATEEPRRSK